MRDALDLLVPKIAKVLHNLQAFTLQWKSEPTLSFTHFNLPRSALLASEVSLVLATTLHIPSRANLILAAGWAQDLMMDLSEFERVRSEL